MFMRIPFLQPRHREFALAPLETADLPAVASIHREDLVLPPARLVMAAKGRLDLCWRGLPPARPKSSPLPLSARTEGLASDGS